MYPLDYLKKKLKKRNKVTFRSLSMKLINFIWSESQDNVKYLKINAFIPVACRLLLLLPLLLLLLVGWMFLASPDKIIAKRPYHALAWTFLCVAKWHHFRTRAITIRTIRTYASSSSFCRIALKGFFNNLFLARANNNKKKQTENNRIQQQQQPFYRPFSLRVSAHCVHVSFVETVLKL